MTDFSLLLPNIFDDNTRADKERMKRMILRLQNLQSFYYYHSEKSFVSVSFHPLSIHPCFVTKQRWAQFCVKDVKGEKRLENLWPKCPPTKPPTSHFVHVEIQRYHLLEGFETRTWGKSYLMRRKSWQMVFQSMTFYGKWMENPINCIAFTFFFF